MKIKRTLLLAAAVLAAAVLYRVVSVHTQVQELLYELSPGETIESLELQNENGHLEFWRDSGGVWMVRTAKESSPEYSVGEEKMMLLLSSLASMPLRRLLPENNPEYGLDESGISVSFTTSEGKHHGFTVGSRTMTQNQVYMKYEETGRPGITDVSATAQLGGGIDAFRSRDIFHVDMDDIRDITYKKQGEESLNLYMKDGEWNMTSPYTSPARKIEITELLASMKDWNIRGFADTSLLPEQQMGLTGDGAFLTLTDGSGRSQTLEIGHAVQSAVFVRNGERDDILLLYEDEVDLSVLQADTLLFFAPLKANVDQVSRIVLTVDRTVLDFSINSDENSFICNGKTLEPEAFYSFYMSYMAMTAVGGDSVVPGIDAGMLASLKTEYMDGMQAELCLIPRDDSTCYMVVNNSPSGFYTSNEKLITLISKLNRLAVY